MLSNRTYRDITLKKITKKPSYGLGLKLPRQGYPPERAKLKNDQNVRERMMIRSPKVHSLSICLYGQLANTFVSYIRMCLQVGRIK